MRKAYCNILFFLIISFQSFGFESIGGNITWFCTGTGRYVFQLTLFRDCNQADIAGNVEKLRVWNHATITEIPVNLSFRTDLSPTCTSAGGANPFVCGIGAGGGNGSGSLEKLVYLSDPMDISGIPPAEGWVFTFETNVRKNTISNLSNPAGSGMTLVSKMFEISSVANPCIDSSPTMLNDPLMLNCTSGNYNFLPNISDIDHDSLTVEFAPIWADFPIGIYQDGVVPASVTFNAGYSFLSPTPNTTFNGSNLVASLDANLGDLNFTSFNPGEYVLKLLVSSYRNGKKNSQVEYEFTINVFDCAFANTAPQVPGPFAGLYEITVAPNTLVNFTLNSTDLEFNQDGDKQKNTLTASGSMFGTNFTATTGCAILPCATLSKTPPITNDQGTTVDFSWQPSCNHLKNLYGNEFETITYDFVFKAQDDVCPLPLSTYSRIRITVKSDITVDPAQITCIQTQANGDLLINWSQAIDPNINFVRYELHSVQSGLITMFNNINTLSYNFTPFIANSDYFIKTVSGLPCAVAVSSDTIRPMALDVIKSASGGIAQLKWNSPFFSNAGHLGNYQIFREYPLGIWTEIGQTNFGMAQFFDTIDICSADLNYQIQYSEGLLCPHISSIDGDSFTDETAPTTKPIINSVSIDTLTGSPIISWNAVSESDTYGYIIYFGNQSTEVDTAVGLATTSYTYTLTNDVDSVSFSLAAIDSCLIIGKTSPESIRHKTCFLQGTYDLCAQKVKLRWTAYEGWTEIKGYEIFIRIDGGSWQDLGFTKNQFFDLDVSTLKNYQIVIQAIDSLSTNTSFSNSFLIFTNAPTIPKFSYTEVATVENGDVLVKHYLDRISGISGVELNRLDDQTGDFEIIGAFNYNSNRISYIDSDVKTDEKPYTYQVRLIDSCGAPSILSNRVTTIFLQVKPDPYNLTNFLTWTPYIGFNGSILYYNIYRGIEGVFGSLPEARVSANELHFLDTLFADIQFNGKICYYVEAVESINIYGTSQISKSNVACSLIEPLIYIPNSFTPNGDGLNEIFLPSINLSDIGDYELNIINRWGELIFRTFDRDRGWDGTMGDNKLVQEGLYQYVLKLKDGEGQEIIQRGFVNLLH